MIATAQATVQIAAPIPQRRLLPPAVVTAIISSPDGRFATGGTATINGAGAAWTAVVRHLNRPGVIAKLFFSAGAREVILGLEDGRRARARIAGTSITAGYERIAQLIGVEPLT